MARTQRQSEYIVMVKTGYECQPEPACRHTVTMLLWLVAQKCCSSQVSPWVSDTLPTEPEFNALVAGWCGST